MLGNMDEFMAQREQANRNQEWRDDAVRRRSPRLESRQEGMSLEITPKEEEGHIPNVDLL